MKKIFFLLNLTACFQTHFVIACIRGLFSNPEDNSYTDLSTKVTTTASTSSSSYGKVEFK